MAKKAKLKTYCINVCRIGYGNLDVEVQAHNAREAKRLAERKAGSYEFSEHSSEYEAQGASEVLDG